MTGIVLAFAAGVIAGALALAGAGVAPWAALALVLAALAPRAAPWRLALAGVLGVIHFEVVMQRHLDRRDALLALPAPLVADGRVAELPDCDARGCAFTFRLDLPPGRVRLFWRDPGRELRPGQRLRLELALAPHWSLRNPGSHDRETWALARGSHARGRVLAALDPPAAAARAWGLDGLRQRLGDDLAERLEGNRAVPLLAALAIGDRRGLDQRHWEVLRRTGTAHLVAISGLHIGLVAGLGFVLGRACYRLLPRPRVTRPGLAAACALVGALGYAALAGFALPTVRALLMLTVPLAALAARRFAGPLRGLGCALGLVLLVDPMAPLATGFWLSFGAVAWLLWVGVGHGSARPLGRALRPQWAVFVGLLPLLAAAGLPVSPLAPLVNLVAIPWVALLVLPPLLAGLAALLLAPPLAGPPLSLSAAALGWLYRGLEWLAHLPAVDVHAATLPVLLLALAGAALMLAPRGWPGRWAGLLLLGPLLRPPAAVPPEGVARVHVLDVGQGTAIVVQTRSRSLLYDAGPGWDGGWNAGDAVVRPFLARLGAGGLEQVVVSHADSDHAGGLAGLGSLVRAADVLGSAPDGRWPRCVAGDAWRWDRVRFEVLHPGRWLPYLGNDSSCVVRVTAGAGRFLLTGDIGAAVERRLAPVVGPVAAISVPHHGSKSSSSEDFLAALKPRLAVVSVGQGNRFGMPHAPTRRRYAAHRAELLTTAECGYLLIEIGPGPDPVLARAERATAGRPWQQPGLCFPAQTGR